MKVRTLQGYTAQQMKKPGFKKAWTELDAEFELLESMLQPTCGIKKQTNS